MTPAWSALCIAATVWARIPQGSKRKCKNETTLRWTFFFKDRWNKAGAVLNCSSSFNIWMKKCRQLRLPDHWVNYSVTSHCEETQYFCCPSSHLHHKPGILQPSVTGNDPTAGSYSHSLDTDLFHHSEDVVNDETWCMNLFFDNNRGSNLKISTYN